MKKKICYVVTIGMTIRAFFIPQLKCLSDKGFDVTVVCSRDEELGRKLGNNIRYIPIDMPRGLELVESLVATKKLYKLFCQEQFDMVQYSTPNAAFYGSIAAALAGIKIRNYHLMGLRYIGECGVKKAVLKLLEKLTCFLSTHIECVSKSNLQLGVQEHLFQSDKAIVVWNGSTGGVNLQRFDSQKRDIWRKKIRRQLGYSEKDFIFGYAGRITGDKGINELLSAFMELGETRCRLLIIGEKENNGSLSDELLKRAYENPNICFLGYVDNIEQYYATFDMLVLPSYREGFGNVIIEAAAVGTPAIVSNIPGPIDAISENKTAIVVPPRSEKDLLMVMRKLQCGNSVLSSDDCIQFVKEHFDSNVLCRKIMQRKEELLMMPVAGGK